MTKGFDLNNDDDCDEQLVDYLYDENYDKLSINKTAQFFAWCGILKPEYCTLPNNNDGDNDEDVGDSSDSCSNSDAEKRKKQKLEEAQETEEDWIDVPPPIHDETTFVVNLGDMLERWTNGLFASTRHRVLNKTGQVRYSVPFFYKPNYEALVSPLDICCCDTNPPRFQPTVCGEHYVAFTRKVTDLSLHSRNTSRCGNCPATAREVPGSHGAAGRGTRDQIGDTWTRS